VNAIDHRPVVFDALGRPNALDYTQFIPMNTKAIQQLSGGYSLAKPGTASSTVLSFYAGTTSPALTVSATGNLGIGTTTSTYRFAAEGQAAAFGFTALTNASTTKDASYATSTADILDMVRTLKVAELRSVLDMPEAPTHLGLLAEDVPQDLRSQDGKGIDLLRLLTALIGSVQTLADRVDSLATEVASLNDRVTALENAAGGAVQTVQQTASNLVSLVTETLTVGSSEKPSGITLYDEDTGAPYCFKIKNGEATSTPGVCATAGSSSDATSTANSGNSEAPVITVTGANPATIDVGATYVDLGATVTDNVNNNLGYKVSVDGGALIDPSAIWLDTSTSTTHTILYSATDQDGNTGTAERIVNVTSAVSAPSEPPSPPSTDESATTTPDSGADTGTTTPPGN
jgi:hypothetical protein